MSNINVMRKNLGPVTAYKYAVQQGYTGTEQEFAALMASYATVAQEAGAAKDDAIDAKTAAEAAQAAAEAAAEQAEGAIEVDDTLSVRGRAADAKVTGGRTENIRNLFEIGGGLVDYDYSKPYERDADPSSSTSFMIGVKRHDNTLVLDGEATKTIYIRVSGEVTSTITSSTVQTWESGVALKEGHDYIAEIKLISGSSLVDEETKTPSISVYKIGESKSVGVGGRIENGYRRTFTADGSDYNIVVYMTSGIVFSNAKFVVTLTDVSEQCVKTSELDYFDSKTNDAFNLIDYGYGSSLQTNSVELGVLIKIERYRTQIKLNLANNNYAKRIFITSKELTCHTASTTYKTETGKLQLKEGYKYRAKIKYISGSGTNAGVNYIPSIAVYDFGTSYNDISTAEKLGDIEKSYTFTAPSGKVAIAIYVAANATLTDAIYDVTLEEMIDNSTELPDYYLPEMTDTIAKVRNATTAPAIVFPMVTDIHRFSANANGVQTFTQMIAAMKYLASECKLDFVLNLGDMTDGNTVQDTTLQRAYECTKDFMNIGVPYLWVNGNHDTNYYTENEPYLFTMDESYKAYFTATKGVTYNVNENGTDYYVDYEALKTRIICVNANNLLSGNSKYSYGRTTAAWLADALNTDYAVIFCTHQSPITSQVIGNQATKNSVSVVNALQSFVDNGGMLIMLSGHSHLDIAFIEPWLCVMSDSQRFTNTEGYSLAPNDDTNGITGFIDNIVKPGMTQYTASEDAWSVCVYKPDINELDVIRFGAGADRYFHATPSEPTTFITKLEDPVTWTTSDSSVATVSDGVVTGVGTGKCAILAKDEAGNYECWIVENES